MDEYQGDSTGARTRSEQAHADEPSGSTSQEQPAGEGAFADEYGPENNPRGEPDPREELFEAIDHFRNAASAFFQRASHDPTFRQATSEAEKAFQKLGERAEPLARQLTGELGKLTRRISDTVEGYRGGRPRHSDEEPPDGER